MRNGPCRRFHPPSKPSKNCTSLRPVGIGNHCPSKVTERGMQQHSQHAKEGQRCFTKDKDCCRASWTGPIDAAIICFARCPINAWETGLKLELLPVLELAFKVTRFGAILTMTTIQRALIFAIYSSRISSVWKDWMLSDTMEKHWEQHWRRNRSQKVVSHRHTPKI